MTNVIHGRPYQIASLAVLHTLNISLLMMHARTSSVYPTSIAKACVGVTSVIFCMWVHMTNVIHSYFNSSYR